MMGILTPQLGGLQSSQKTLCVAIVKAKVHHLHLELFQYNNNVNYGNL